MIPVQAAFVVFAGSLGTSSPIAAPASQFVSHFAENVHAGGRMRQCEKTYVLYSQTVQRNANQQQRWRGRKEMSSRVK